MSPEVAMPEGEERPPAGVRTMALVRWGIVVAVAVLAVVSVASTTGVFGGRGGGGGQIYSCPMHPQIVQDHPGQCPICGMDLVPRASRPLAAAAAADAGATGKYYCPMHPQVTSDDPNATCALCGGMKLVPRPVAGVPGLVPVDLPPDRVQRIGVRTAKAERAPLPGALRTVGVVAASERGMAQISARFSGWIDQLMVQETGKRVARGQPLAAIYSPELLQAQQELLSALGWTAAAPAGGGPHAGHGQGVEGLVADARSRLELLGIAPQEIEAIVRERKARRALALRSPVDGHVVAKSAVVGMAVQPGVPLFEVADLSTVWVVADVYESDLSRVRVGQPARFSTTAFPGEEFAGKVSLVYPSLEASTRTLRVRLELRNRPGPGGLKLRPGMYGNVALELPAAEALMVPAEAVVDTGDVQYVFVDRGGGRYEPRRVTLGARGGDRVAVAEGLAAGEVVVTTANFLIDSESRLRAAVEGKAAAPAPAAAPAHQH